MLYSWLHLIALIVYLVHFPPHAGYLTVRELFPPQVVPQSLPLRSA